MPVLIGALLASCAGPRAVEPRLDDLEVSKLAGDLGFTEGPVWIQAEELLVFSDIPAARLMSWHETRGLELHEERPNPNGNALDANGRLLTCQHGARNLVRREADGALTVLARDFEGLRLNSPNDLAVQADGTIWFTDPPWGLEGLEEGKQLDFQGVYRLDGSTGELRCVLRDGAMPNGIALAADERTLYVADTGGGPLKNDPRRRSIRANLTAWEVRGDGSLAPEPRWRIATRCDGMCLDEHGNLYTTGEAVNVWRPDGTPIGSIPVPETPANVTFGGADGRTLFITARTSLYAVRLEVAGAPSLEPSGHRW